MIPIRSIRRGNIIRLDGALCRVLDVTFLNPGNWRAMIHLKARNIATGSQVERRFSTDEKVEKAISETRPATYLYHADDRYHFMETESYEQLEFDAETLGDATLLLREELEVQIVYLDGKPQGIELPKSMEFEVIETEPSLKGATAQAQTKPATLEGGMVVQVPAFIQVGDRIRIDTEEMRYLERAK